MQITKNMIRDELTGKYGPTALNSVIFFIWMAPTILLVQKVTHNIVRGEFRGTDIVALLVLFIYSVVFSEFSFRKVIVTEDFVYSYAPFRIYRQKLEMSEISGIRKNMNNPVEIRYRGQWIILASTSTFKDAIGKFKGQNNALKSLNHYKTILIILMCISISSSIFMFIQYAMYPSLLAVRMKAPSSLMICFLGLAAIVNVICGIQHRKMWVRGELIEYGHNVFDRISYVVLLILFLGLGIFSFYMTLALWIPLPIPFMQ